MRTAKLTPTWLGVIAVATIAMMALALFVRSLVLEARERPECLACDGRLVQLAMAIYVYNLGCGTIPPAFVEDKNGRRMHSWRVLVRRFFCDNSPSAYDFNKPWNDSANVMASSIFDLYEPYVCPSDKRARARGLTNYVAVVGKNTLWPGKKGYTSSDADCGKIVLMELPGSDIKWTEPRDITVDEAIKIYREWKGGQNRAGYRHLNYVTFGGKYYGDISSIPNEETFRKMLTVGKTEK